LRALIERGKLRAVALRVLHVDTERGWRGGERQALWLAREMDRRGYGSILAVRRGEPLSARAAEAGLTVVDCSPFGEIDPRAAWRLRGVIRDHRIDIVHAHTAHAVAVTALAILGTSVPLVVSRRVDFPLRTNAGTRWKYGRASVVIAISQAVARVLETSGVAADRIVVVPDGVDVGRDVRRATPETLASLGVSANGRLIVQVAQLVGHKDPFNFVRAMARVVDAVPGAQGLLVGDGPLRSDVEREIHRLGLESSVRLAGYRTDADSLLAAADVACLSSREEGMGSVLLDALAFGVPVAATRAGGIPEVIVDEECGLLADREDPRALGDAIARLIRDDALRARVRANARPRANEFSVERMTDRTIAVYESVLASRGRSRTAATSASNSASVTGAP
jgi:glycosyltransferase involved in cell wall biosynthesis